MKTPMTLGLARYDAMIGAIEKCREFDEIKEIRNEALAIEKYCAAAQNRDAEYHVMEIRHRAERRAGEMLREANERGQRAKRGDKGPTDGRGRRPSVNRPTLEKLGVSKDQSSEWQKLASVPKEKFEELVKKPGIRTEEILRKSGVVKDPPPPAYDVRVMWVRGILRDFDHEKIDSKHTAMALEPAAIVSKMDEIDKKACKETLPRFLKWWTKFYEEVLR